VTFARQPVRVATGGLDEEGCLIFSDDRLVAVMVRLSDQHEEFAGEWFLEAGFGRLEGPQHPTFDDLEAAQTWIAARLVAVGRNLA
jgi:hypothetical protein